MGGPDVRRLPRDALVPDQLKPSEPPTLVFSAPCARVVGAGVSTCAPVGCSSGRAGRLGSYQRLGARRGAASGTNVAMR